jgi:hypothetical protein
MWPRRSEILAPLTCLTSKDVPFQWTDVKQQVFDKIKSILSCLEMTSDMESLDMADCYGLNSDDLPDNAFPISYTLIDHEQKKNKTLLK